MTELSRIEGDVPRWSTTAESLDAGPLLRLGSGIVGPRLRIVETIERLIADLMDTNDAARPH